MNAAVLFRFTPTFPTRITGYHLFTHKHDGTTPPHYQQPSAVFGFDPKGSLAKY